jgi:hypothetical protein
MYEKYEKRAGEKHIEYPLAGEQNTGYSMSR